ncbi:hypothetical protein [Bacillus sp. EAC]|uniref:hypothetical protein n=1 Tax=Bacillus sp. EAC TaxID=1978338 RepID=UPI000B448BCB|nr:hypothetical protein [Bacillus sp. EAC]
MKKKFAKKKIVAGLIIAGLVSSAGTAFASSNAGDLFTKYANTILNDAKSTVSKTLGTQTTDKINSMQNRLNTYVGDTGTAINNKAGELATSGASTINGQYNDHQSELNAALQSINSSTPGQFSALIEQLNAKTTAGVEGQVAGLKPDFSTQVSNGQQSINNEKAKALQALEKAINDAKASLTQLIDLQKGTADSQVKTYLTNQIAVVQQLINQATEELEFKKARALGDKASSIKDSAVTDMANIANTLYTAQKSVLEDFEDTSYAFPMVGDWVRSNERIDGESDYYTISNNITNDQTSTSNVTITVPNNAYNSYLSFDYLVRSQQNKDFLTISLDGTVLVSDSGAGGHWTNLKQAIQPGTHTLTLSYSKDKSGSANKDAGFVDNILLTYDQTK